ncbi:hypothetical protein Y1Q_0011810 [Alligator mississippiensis]|uniref:Uncharacterized protein n=1 Tax=Alligator mississippiensis TaxID=8496 RepID=A0A151M175_ALLMI|nr:hypothetical protein Y1Q_0011810 [Alligator mississippiensis]
MLIHKTQEVAAARGVSSSSPRECVAVGCLKRSCTEDGTTEVRLERIATNFIQSSASLINIISDTIDKG